MVLASQHRDPGAFACNSRVFSLGDFGGPGAEASSPDGQDRVVLTKSGAFAVMHGAKHLAIISVDELSSNIEVGWASDSRQFFLSWSGGGAIGEYYVRVFRLDEDRVVELDAPKIAFEDFRKHHWCQARGDNVFMLGWTPDSRNLFVVAEVCPTSDCKEWGLFRGYLMDAQTGTILKVFGEKETEAIEQKSRLEGAVQVPGIASPGNL
jgi:hypothetical protein